MPRENAIVESAIMERIEALEANRNIGHLTLFPIGSFFRPVWQVLPTGTAARTVMIFSCRCATDPLRLALVVQDIYSSACSATGTV